MTKSKRFNIYFYVELISSILFSLISLSFHSDISLLAFPIAICFTGVTVYFSFFKFIKIKDGSKISVALKLIQYLPYVLLLSFVLRRAGDFGTSFVYDIFSVLFWCITFIFSQIISFCMNEKRISKYTEDWKNAPKKQVKPKGSKRIIYEIFDWVDALVQAVFMVLLIQIFILQLYVIPSESMVPTFLIKDRVAVSKINCGPKFPLTEVGLPCFTKYKRGDIVVFRNPHYSMDRKSEVKSVTSQLVYMLTFMSVNLNTDEDGKAKADPLVKRITGVEGEQLVMQDGVLYSRTKESDEFKPVPLDAKYACWNLHSVDPSLKSGIEDFRMTNTFYQGMLELEKERRDFDLAIAKIQAKEIVNNLTYLLKDKTFNGTFAIPVLNQKAIFYNNADIARRIYLQDGGLKWFSDFMTSWIPAADKPMDYYSEANFKMNVMEKIYFGNLVNRYIELMIDDISSSDWANDDIIYENSVKYGRMEEYIELILDERNMPVFPPNDKDGNPQYIPEDCFFMMGDNRFNSLDLRHRYEMHLEKLAKDDPYSLEYDSLMEPQYINKKYILGKPMFRFWPAGRIGGF